MELGLYTDSVPDLSLDGSLDLARRVGASVVEIAGGGQSSAPHLRVRALLEDTTARERFRSAIHDRGLRLGALNCSAWPLHPVKGEAQAAIIRATIRLAEQLDVHKIVTMSGTPGDGHGSTTVNWIWYPWPPDAVDLLDRQWDAAIPFWKALASYAADHGIERIALELHPLHLVYNLPTLQRMRDAVGPIIGANVDPSHMFWQQMDPIAMVRALGSAVHHVHLKDVEIVPDQVALAGVLDQRPFEELGARAWVFRTVGRSHDQVFWSAFLDALDAAGYDDFVSIENEDLTMPPATGVEEAASFILPLMSGRQRDGIRRSAAGATSPSVSERRGPAINGAT